MRPTREHRTGRPLPAWPCSGWGLPSRAGHPAAGELLPHRFTLTSASAASRGRRSVLCGTFRGSPRLGVTQHPALWSPDFPRPRDRARGRPADSSGPSIGPRLSRTGRGRGRARRRVGREPLRRRPRFASRSASLFRSRGTCSNVTRVESRTSARASVCRRMQRAGSSPATLPTSCSISSRLSDRSSDLACAEVARALEPGDRGAVLGDVVRGRPRCPRRSRPAPRPSGV